MTESIQTSGAQLRGLIALALLCVLLVACAPVEPPGPSAEEIAELSDRAERRIAEDRPLTAAGIYSDLVGMTEGDEAQRWRLAMVEVLFDHGYEELALEQHARLDAAPVPEELRLRKRVTDAQAAITRRQSIRALRLLPDVEPGMPAELRARILATRADAYALTGQVQRAMRERVRREPLLTRASMIKRNQEQIWNLLETLAEGDLETLRDEAETRIEQGWADIALRMRHVRTGRTGLETAMAEWQRRYPGHPGIEHFADAIRERVIAEMTLPERVDVLLPLTGRLGESAQAIRDGMLAAYYSTPAYIERPRLVFHDIGEDGSSPEAAYRDAIAAGTRFLVGPLDRDTVARIADLDSHPVPILTLNYTGTSSADNLYQFGLRPEDEARQVAEGAIENDRFNAVALVPANEWGDRLLASFSERFEELGGVLLESAEYHPQDTDYSHAIQAILNLDDSRARHRLVQSTIGESVRFEPRPRDDAEVVFLAALPRQGRLAKPQLDFHRIGATPIYSTSHVYSGRFDPDADWDLNGLYFTEIPWILNTIDDSPDDVQRVVAREWPDASRRFPRLFALGTDAFDLIAHIPQLSGSSEYSHAGRTGRLRMDSEGRIRRELRWARFERGVPVSVETPATELELDIPLGTDIVERAGES